MVAADEKDDPEVDRLTDKNIAILSTIIRKIGKHQLMEDIRDTENCFEMFAEGKWRKYREYINERIEHTFECENCGEPFDDRYGCICGGLEEMKWSFA